MAIQEQMLHWVELFNDPLWNFLVYLLLAVGLFFTLMSGFVQFRLFFHSIAVMKGSRKTSTQGHGLTPFQAFVTGLASRVGVGNIGGVAIAIAIGGPGAVFWMWITALLGMSSAFAESTLAQLFKFRDPNTKQFRGGPAYYITNGLKNKPFGIIFALSMILAYGFVFNSVQANAMVKASSHAWGWDQANIVLNMGSTPVVISWVGLGLVILTAIAIFGGIQRIAKFAETFVPLKAGIYLALALFIAVMNYEQVPHIFYLIFTEAFKVDAAAGGLVGGLISVAMMQGIKRGLFSNEAGMGSAPNAAAASDVPHPVNQGLVQMLGVFVDTFIICTSTALIILLSGAYTQTGYEGVELTQYALETQLGHWGGSVLAILLFLFCYSAILGNYAYAESNIQFIHNSKVTMFIFRLCVLVMVYFGAVTSVKLVWSMADLSMGIMATINLIAIMLLSPLVFRLIKDYTRQRKLGIEPEFKLSDHPEMQKKVKSDIW